MYPVCTSRPPLSTCVSTVESARSRDRQLSQRRFALPHRVADASAAPAHSSRDSHREHVIASVAPRRAITERSPDRHIRQTSRGRSLRVMGRAFCSHLPALRLAPNGQIWRAVEADNGG